jgi:hypothetical protein
MSRDKPSKSSLPGMPSSRRDVLAGAGAFLGASILVQPNGGVAYAKEGGSKAGGSAIKSTGPTAPKNPPIKDDAARGKKKKSADDKAADKKM